MSELQDAFDAWETRPIRDGVDDEALEIIVEAARKYANLHESIDLDRLSDGLEFAHITDSDAEYLVYVAKQVQLALGVSEDA